MKKAPTAPNSTAKNIPGCPFIQKKSLKFIPDCIAKIMLGESPIMVAVPCRLADKATPISKGTGFNFIALAISKAMGATIKIVATFSVKLEINPLNPQTNNIAMHTLLDLSTNVEAR